MTLPPPRRAADTLPAAVAGAMQQQGQDPNAYLGAYQNDAPEATHWDAVLSSPEFQRVMQEFGPQGATEWLRDRYGLDGEWVANERGELEPRRNWLQRNLHWVAPAAVGAGIGAGALAGAGGAAGAAGATAPEIAISSTPGLAAGTTVPGAVSAASGASAAGGGGMWGTIGNILAGRNPVANTIFDAAGKVSGVLGSTVAGRQQGREAEALFQQRQDQLAQQRYLNQLAGARLRLDAPQERAKTSVRGDVLSNAQDFSWGAPEMVGNIPVPTSRGGLRPSILSDASRTLGRDISQQALTDQQTDHGQIIPNPPELTGLPTAGRGDSLLNTASLVSSLFGAIPYVRRPQQGGA